jgi:hypothetical protein
MMTRSAPLLLALATLPFAAAAQADDKAAPPASHSHHARHHARHTQRATAQAAPPPAAQRLPAAIAGTQPAPVPNEDVTDVPPGQAPATTVTPSLLQLHYPNVGDGYIEGSSPQEMDDRNAAKAPGVEVQVPLKQ